MPNINIQIPDDLHKKIKLEALKQDLTLKDYIIKTMEDEVNE